MQPPEFDVSENQASDESQGMASNGRQPRVGPGEGCDVKGIELSGNHWSDTADMSAHTEL